RSVWADRCTLLHVSSRFFFSSRRRHTILVSDWSSDVCSSDLANAGLTFVELRRRDGGARALVQGQAGIGAQGGRGVVALGRHVEIGRASCRERGEGAVAARSWERYRGTRAAVECQGAASNRQM